MKLVKLSLVAALAAGAFSVANATPLEEAIKDIDVSGVLRYRYETSNEWNNRDYGSGVSGKQDHKYRAQVNFSGAIADNFKAFVQFDYNAKDGGYVNNSSTTTGDSATLHVRQLYLTYTNEDVATSVILGKQQLNTIWTDNGIDGLVGTGVKVVNNSIDGLTLAAFAVDSYNSDEQSGDLPSNIVEILDTNGDFLRDERAIIPAFGGNLYGAAAIGSYEVLGGQLNSQLWLSYLNDAAFFYALDVAYSTTIFDGINWTLEGAYLGNSLDNTLKNSKEVTLGGVYDSANDKTTYTKGSFEFKNGNLFALRGSIEVNGWDATLGGLYYGKKDGFTINAIEDQGNLGSLLAGEEIFYTTGSRLSGDIGQNTFGYIKAGYTFNETVRVGADFVYGGTKTVTNSGGDKLEAVARVSYKYSPKLNFSAYYSYTNVDYNTESTHHDVVRLQALYKF